MNLPTIATLPLTEGQIDFWEEFLAHPGQPVSTVAHVTCLEGDLHIEALATAIRAMISETDVLALRFCDSAGPCQVVDPQHRPALTVLDLRGEADPDAAAEALMQADLGRPLDLRHGPLAATWLLRVGERRVMWYLRGHHIFLDGYSMALIERRVARLYAHLVAGEDAGPPFARFADYMDEESRYAGSPRHEAARAFWRDYLNAGPLPRSVAKGSEDYPAAPLSAEIALDHLSEPLRQASRRLGLGWPDLLTGLVALWLWHCPPDGSAPRESRIAWLPVMGRMGSVAAHVPAMALNILPFRIAPDPGLSLSENLLRMAADLTRLRRHGRFRVEAMGRDFGLGDSRRFFFSPLINVMPFDPAHFAGCMAQRRVLAAGPGDGFNVTIGADPRGGGLLLHLDADPSLTPPALFASHATGLPEFLGRALSASPDLALDRLLPA